MERVVVAHELTAIEGISGLSHPESGNDSLHRSRCTSATCCQHVTDSLPALFQCTLTERGAVRVRTPFMYPDGDIINAFVESTGETYSVTDYGQCAGWRGPRSLTRLAWVRGEAIGHIRLGAILVDASVSCSRSW
ncbi:MAG: hypothetical protein OXI96_04055 [Acidimicrobiaceae bacterium]|nr:hypothetical protein [Acidimicrobiaceae bacterium]